MAAAATNTSLSGKISTTVPWPSGSSALSATLQQHVDELGVVALVEQGRALGQRLDEAAARDPVHRLVADGAVDRGSAQQFRVGRSHPGHLVSRPVWSTLDSSQATRRAFCRTPRFLDLG
jgi:hypothetical protein